MGAGQRRARQVSNRASTVARTIVASMTNLSDKEVEMGELTDKAKGKAKQMGGIATGDRELEAEGKVDESKGKVKGAFEDVKQGIKEAVRGDPKP
jgi:uncharacterized protein YjbJ (UPF0337 family)